MAAEPMRRYGVGYGLAPKKQASFMQVSLINLAKDKGINLIMIDTEKPLIEQGPFDCVLHKLYGEDWKNQLRHYSSLNPNALIIDAPEAIKRLHNHISMLQVVTELKIVSDMASFGIPKQFVIESAEAISELRVEKEGLKFPVIAKPLVAVGSAKSHKMSLVFNYDNFCYTLILLADAVTSAVGPSTSSRRKPIILLVFCTLEPWQIIHGHVQYLQQLDHSNLKP